jgi:hypothetical protein
VEYESWGNSLCSISSERFFLAVLTRATRNKPDRKHDKNSDPPLTTKNKFVCTLTATKKIHSAIPKNPVLAAIDAAQIIGAKQIAAEINLPINKQTVRTLHTSN